MERLDESIMHATRYQQLCYACYVLATLDSSHEKHHENKQPHEALPPREGCSARHAPVPKPWHYAAAQ